MRRKVATLRTLRNGLIALIVLTNPFLAHAQEAGQADQDDAVPACDKGELEAKWDGGLKFETADGCFKAQIGGRLQSDFAFSESNVAQNGSELRRARLFVSGTIYRQFEYKLQYDFAGGDASAKDIFVGVKNVFGGSNPTGLRIGHQKEPFSLEGITSSKYLTFMERGLPLVFGPSGDRNTGVKVGGKLDGAKLIWEAGVFQEVDSSAFGVGDNYNYSARLVRAQPFGDGHLFHLGVSFSHREVDGVLRFRQRPEAHLSPSLVDTGTFEADSVDVLGLEAAVVIGRFHASSEFIQASVSSRVADDPSFSGFYASAGFFLTGGDGRAYRNRDTEHHGGYFDRTKPAANFLQGGPGAWEIAARYSTLDLQSGLIQGGELDDLTIALNWYWNPHIRLMFNYVNAEVEDGLSTGIFQWRTQIDF